MASTPASILSSRIHLVCLLTLLSCLPASAESPRDLDEVVASGQLVMITFPHQESVFSRTDLGKGAPMPRLGGYADFEGIDVDLMQGFAESLGVELRIRPVSEPRYGALIPDLLGGRGDLIASSLTITPERLQKVNFSRPYFEVYPVIVTPEGSGPASVEELPEHVGVVTAGSSHEERLLGMGIEPAILKRVDFSIETFGALLDHDADYTLADSLIARRFVRSEPGLRVAFRLEGRDEYGFAVPKTSPHLLEALNRYLDRAESSGELERVLVKHVEGNRVERSISTGVMQAPD